MVAPKSSFFKGRILIFCCRIFIYRFKRTANSTSLSFISDSSADNTSNLSETQFCIKNDALFLKNVLQMMNSAFKLMNFPLKMMPFVFQKRNSAIKMMNFEHPRKSHCGGGIASM